MIEVFNHHVADDFGNALAESFEDYDQHDFDRFEAYAASKNYNAIFKEFVGSWHQYFRPNDGEELEKYGEMNLFFNVFNFNKTFYTYLLYYIEHNYEEGAFVEFITKYLRLLLKDYPESPIYRLIELYYQDPDGSLKIEYKDTKGKITERVVSDIDLDIDGVMSSINCYCHLRDEERNFRLINILSVESAEPVE